MSDRCHVCDRVGCKSGKSDSVGVEDLRECASHIIDWRARALKAERRLAIVRNRVHNHNVTDACTGERDCWCDDCQAGRAGVDDFALPAVQVAITLRDVERAAMELQNLPSPCDPNIWIQAHKKMWEALQKLKWRNVDELIAEVEKSKTGV